MFKMMKEFTSANHLLEVECNVKEFTSSKSNLCFRRMVSNFEERTGVCTNQNQKNSRSMSKDASGDCVATPSSLSDFKEEDIYSGELDEVTDTVVEMVEAISSRDWKQNR
jgi:hypothetical protein